MDTKYNLSITTSGENGDHASTNISTGDPGDFFTYSCSDGNENSNISTVTIAILPSNDAPILDNIPILIMFEDLDSIITVTGSDEEGHDIFYYCEPGENISCSEDENNSGGWYS